MYKASIFFALVFVLSSCADGRRFTDDGSKPRANPGKPDSGRAPQPAPAPSEELTVLGAICEVRTDKKVHVVGPIKPEPTAETEPVENFREEVLELTDVDRLTVRISFPRNESGIASRQRVVFKLHAHYFTDPSKNEFVIVDDESDVPFEDGRKLTSKLNNFIYDVSCYVKKFW